MHSPEFCHKCMRHFYFPHGGRYQKKVKIYVFCGICGRFVRSLRIRPWDAIILWAIDSERPHISIEYDINEHIETGHFWRRRVFLNLQKIANQVLDRRPAGYPSGFI